MATLDNLKVPRYPLYKNGDAGDFKAKLLRVARLRARARDMFTGIGKDEKAAHLDGSQRLAADDLAALESENERAFVDF